MRALVCSAGFLTTVQDLGRTGFRRSGVSVGGALDSHAMRVANALVGNIESAAGLEATLGNVRLQFADQHLVAWCGGAFELRLRDEVLPSGHAGLIAKDEELLMTAPKAGARAWLAISGGIDVPLVLGSRSTDLRGKFGGVEGRALRDGDVIPLGAPSHFSQQLAAMFGEQRVSPWTAPAPWATRPERARFLRIVRGSDWSRFTSEGQRSFREETFTVTNKSDRMGVRLDGPVLERLDSDELFSEAVLAGTVQIPPDGKPIILLADCQTIGGYPKIAHVITVDLPLAAQLWPGDHVRFCEVALAEAQDLLLGREKDLARFRMGMELRAK